VDLPNEDFAVDEEVEQVDAVGKSEVLELDPVLGYVRQFVQGRLELLGAGPVTEQLATGELVLAFAVGKFRLKPPLRHVFLYVLNALSKQALDLSLVCLLDLPRFFSYNLLLGLGLGSLKLVDNLIVPGFHVPHIGDDFSVPLLVSHAVALEQD
jgi:hypothetical protein